MVSPGTRQRLLTVAQWLPLALLIAFPPHPALQTAMLALLSLSMLVEFRRISAHTRAFLSDSVAAGMLWGEDVYTPAVEPAVALAPPPLTPLPEAQGPVRRSQTAASAASSSSSATAAGGANGEKKKTPKERPLPSYRRFSLLGLLRRLLAAIPTGRPPREEMPDVVLLVAGGY